jgi:hypothetical protein
MDHLLSDEVSQNDNNGSLRENKGTVQVSFYLSYISSGLKPDTNMNNFRLQDITVTGGKGEGDGC